MLKNNKKNIIVVVAVLISVLIFLFLFNKDFKNNLSSIYSKSSYPESQNYPFYQSNYINKNLLSSGYYDTEGYVIKQNKCDCPEGALCKCKPLSITISRNSNLIDAYPYGDSELEIVVKDPKEFEIDQRYKFSIKLTKNDDYSSSTIELVGYEKISRSASFRDEMSKIGCPDALIVDKMPGPSSADRKPYYIKDGSRIEFDDYDPIWVNANCDVREQEVF